MHKSRKIVGYYQFGRYLWTFNRNAKEGLGLWRYTPNFRGMKKYYYDIANLTMTLSLPEGVAVDTLLPTMRGFRVESAGEQAPILEAECVAKESIPNPEAGEVLEQVVNDMGCVTIIRVEGGYVITTTFDNHQHTHCMYLAECFSKALLLMDWQDKMCHSALSSLLRIAFGQAIVWHNGVSIHSSTVTLGDKAYMFLGKSGTGKSTHSRMWLESFPECELLNDDNPMIRVEGGEVKVYGTPWSGKTHCYKNRSAQVQGLVRLRQAPENRFTRRRGCEAFVELLPSCAVLRFDDELYDKMCDTLAAVALQTTVGVMDCLPNTDAAQVCRAAVEK